MEAALRERAPQVPWQARNQAAVHTWYHRRFGERVAPLVSAGDGVGTWPETATVVAVRLGEDGEIAVLAPFGVQDLLAGLCRRNPRRVSVQECIDRLRRKDVRCRWPHVKVIADR